jgi:DNA-directed RNA polymerase specialized sigma24 family protein
MPAISTARAQWLAIHIIPLEPQLRRWLKRAAPHALEADDLIQEAYAKLAGLTTISNITHPKAYLYQTIKRLILDHIRRSKLVSIEAMAEVAQPAVLEGVDANAGHSGLQHEILRGGFHRRQLRLRDLRSL